MAQSQNLDIIANNLANANTAGFKKDAPTFKEYLTSVERPTQADIDIPRTIFKDSDFYHTDGREHAMVNLHSVHTDHAQGALRPTNAPFDLAVEGAGFFAVQAPGGVMYTRSGYFKVNGDGALVTNDGFPVLALSGEAAALKTPEAVAAAQAQGGRSPASVNPFTSTPAAAGAQALLKPVMLKDALQAGQKISIGADGQIYGGDDSLGFLAVAEFANPQALKKVTATLYANADAANVGRIATQSNVRQGFLESSNVNPVSELMEMLKANRMYESNMKAIKAYNDMAGKEANEVGKL
jgi:flagellar basal-body rod protein FlgG